MSSQHGGGRPRSSKSKSKSASSRSTLRSSGGNSKACKKSYSDSPSRSSFTTGNGKWEVDEKIRSVLSHPLVLPLLCSLHGKDPGKLEYLSKKSNFYDDKSEGKTNFDDILGAAVTNWMKDSPKRNEYQLTELLVQKIEEKYVETKFHCVHQAQLKIPNTNILDGKMDIIFTPDADKNKIESSCTPLAMCEIGRNDGDWWKKMDQNLTYLKTMRKGGQSDSRLGFLKPMILATLTIDDENEKKVKTRLGVFLCSPKGNDARGGDYRISLLWHSYKEGKLASSSEDFGNLLRAISDFGRWREESEPSNWEYLGPNCCKVVVDQNGEKESKVLRSYDTRFRPTHRRSVIYEEHLKCEPFLEVQRSDAFKDVAPDIRLWRPEGELKVIATPYREGRHYATNPAEFVPIICELEKLHNAGFVHGDIRAFNTVFADKEKGWLIDFDFGGKAGQESLTYPRGYNTTLQDGIRPGKGGMKIEQWHDWRALGALIFHVHLFKPTEKADTNLVSHVSTSWLDLQEQPTDKMINDLKDLCRKVNDAEGWKLKLHFNFVDVLNEVQDTSKRIPVASHPAATGSPPAGKGRQ